MKFFRNYVKTPSIFSCLGFAGMVSTTILAVRATPKAIRLIEEDSAKKHNGNPRAYSNIEAIKSAWKMYIPSFVTGIFTTFCIFEADSLHRRRQAAIFGSYILLDQSYREYKRKVENVIGKEKETEIRESILRDRYSKYKEIGPCDKLLFYIDHYDRFFERTMLEVQEAEYLINRKFAEEGCVCLNDLFELLDIPRNNVGAMLGWSQDSNYDKYGRSWIDFEHELVTLDDNLECRIITMINPPEATYLPF